MPRAACGFMPALLIALACAALGVLISGGQAFAEPALVRTQAYWGEKWRERPLMVRVGPASPEVLAYLQQDGGLDKLPEAVADEELQQLVARALQDIEAALPEHLAEALRQGLTGVFLARDIGSSGYVESVEASGEKLAFVVLDAGMMQGRSANAWASMREASFFRPASAKADSVSISMTIADTEQDDELHGLRYILLHELGHCVGLLTGAHADWMAPSEVHAAQPWPFVACSWRMKEGRFVPKQDYPWRSKLRIYAFADSSLAAAQAPGIYETIFEHSAWPTLYASVSPFEDFAESFAVWQHAVRDKRPWRVTVQAGNVEAVHYASCLQTGSCSAKAAFMRRLFAGQ